MTASTSRLNDQPTLVLASTSRYRAALLRRLGVDFVVSSPDVDEEIWKSRGLEPQVLAESLAQAKAESVFEKWPDRKVLVIGSDQVCAIDGELLGKPGSHDLAVRQLTQLSGRPHRLITSVCLRHAEGKQLHTDITTLWMRSLTQDELERYAAADEPWDCAGSYQLEARGICLFERIDSADHSAITGLPLIWLTTALRQHGLAIP